MKIFRKGGGGSRTKEEPTRNSRAENFFFAGMRAVGRGSRSVSGDVSVREKAAGRGTTFATKTIAKKDASFFFFAKIAAQRRAAEQTTTTTTTATTTADSKRAERCNSKGKGEERK